MFSAKILLSRFSLPYMLIWASSQWILRFAFLIMCRVLEHCGFSHFFFINIWSIPFSLFSIHDTLSFLFVFVGIQTHTEAYVQVFVHIMHMALEVPLELSTLFLRQHLLGFWGPPVTLGYLVNKPQRFRSLPFQHWHCSHLPPCSVFYVDDGSWNQVLMLTC